MLEIRTEKFKDNLLVFYKLVPISSIDITQLHILLYMLRERTEAFPDASALARRKMELYDTKIGWSYAGYGAWLLLSFHVSYIHSRWLQDADYLKGLEELIDQYLNHPYLTQKGLDEAKILYTNHLLTLNENPDHVAMVKAIEGVDSSQNLSHDMFGKLETVADTTLGQIQALYDRLQEIPYFIAAAGEIEKPVRTFLESIRSQEIHSFALEMVADQIPAYFRQSKPISQTSLFQIYATHVSPLDPEYLALVLGNALLGKSQNSLLFEEVREKHSFCYGISSSVIMMDGALFLRAEILPESIEEAIALIAEQIERIKTGDYSDLELERAKKDLISQVRSRSDSANLQIEQAVRDLIVGRSLSQKEQIEKIQAVTKKEIADAFARIRLLSQAIIEPERESSSRDMELPA